MRLSLAYRVHPPRGGIGPIGQDHLVGSERMPRQFFAPLHVGQLHRPNPAAGDVHRHMGPPLDGFRPGAVNHGRIDHPQPQLAGGLRHLIAEQLPQHVLQPELGLAQTVKQARAGDLGQIQGTGPGGHILQRQVRNRVGQHQAHQGGGIRDLAAAKQGAGAARRFLQILGQQNWHQKQEQLREDLKLNQMFQSALILF